MAYPSQTRYPHGMATIQMVPGLPGTAHVPGTAGTMGVPMMPNRVTRTQNGMGSLYASEKTSGLYQSAGPSYPGMAARQGYLTTRPSSLGQPTYYGTPPHATYVPVTTANGQPRYLMSTAYPGYVSAPSMLPSAAGYPPSMGDSYSMSGQQSGLVQSVQMGGAPSLSSQSQSRYPNYVGSPPTPLQICPSRSPYATSATGYPRYPASAYASSQMQSAQVPGQVPSAYTGKVAPGSGLPLGYPTTFYPAPWKTKFVNAFINAIVIMLIGELQFSIFMYCVLNSNGKN